VRPLNTILEAAKMRRELVWAFSEQNRTGVLFLERVGRLYEIEGDAALKPGARRLGARWPGATRTLRAAGEMP
jgi:hypothetical protein